MLSGCGENAAGHCALGDDALLGLRDEGVGRGDVLPRMSAVWVLALVEVFFADRMASSSGR